MRRHFRSERRCLRAYARAASREVDLRDDYDDEICRRVDAQASAAAIARALASLSRGDYEVLSLWCWAELSYDEIAAALEIPTGTVRSRLHRARHKVREHLDPPPVLEPDDG
jgi:RNA polymerase sigma-70 factor (ECF subfamily)